MSNLHRREEQRNEVGAYEAHRTRDDTTTPARLTTARTSSGTWTLAAPRRGGRRGRRVVVGDGRAVAT